MGTATRNSYDAHDEVNARGFDIERLVRAVDNSADDDFALGEPWNGALDALDDDPE